VSSVKSVVKPGDVIWVQREIRSHGKFREWNLPDGHNPAWLATDDQHAWDDAHADTVVLDQVPHPEGALFTADHKTGYVAAMVGGYDYARSVFNRAFQACRQPGSTYKPIYYSLALDQGFGYDSLYGDRAVAQVDPVTGETWMPSDYGGTDDIDVTLEYALVYSKNQPSLEIFHDVGTKNFVDWARRLGFTTEIIPDQALALGASCTLMPEMAKAFATFARNGKKLDWVYVRRILDRDGNLVEDNTVAYDPELPAADRLDRIAVTAGAHAPQAITARTGYLTSKLLRTVIQFGFSNVVRATDIPTAGKTGTSSATMDTHFIAYSSHFVTAVWLGDDLRERPLGKKDAAFMIVEPLWARYMYEVSRGYPNVEIPWEVPPGVRANDRGDMTKGRRGEQMDLVYKKPEKPGADDGAPDGGGGGPTNDGGNGG
jgi:penicillin-binding protein 1A